MTSNIDDDQIRYLDPEQISRARHLLKDGWDIADVARDCGLSVAQLQAALDLPQWRDIPPVDQSAIGD